MIRWYHRWLGVKINQVNSVEESYPSGLVPLRESDDLHSEPIHFRMFKASGGWAIEFRRYDPTRDRHDTALYAVNDEEEIGHHISQIITMEALKR